MARPEKVQAVADIKERIEGAEGVFVTEFRGLTVSQLSDLRRGLRESGAEYKVVKMTLARRAIGELGIDGLEEHLSGPSALTFVAGDLVAAAKTLRDADKDIEPFVLKAGMLPGGQVILPEQISQLAEIEPREVLLAKIAGAAKAPLYGVATMLSSFTRNAATMFSQLLEKKESGEAPAGDADVATETPAADTGDQTEAEVAPEEPAADTESESSEEPAAESAEEE